ncbi:MAG: substrate-binding domain-containing protein [Actinobacteria bacterium]|nr:substrate-binding domain-containing protein [Actinomycetota bacterium]
MRRLKGALLLAAVALLSVAPTARANPAKINGDGSTYVALAMQQWVADAQTSGLQVNYTPTGSPQGLTHFGQSVVDFAGTEAEYSALGNAGGADQRGYQYVPDVAGAVAVMYNVDDKAGRKVDYLHLSRETIARVFIGDISSWSDPAIAADNGGLQLPDQPITVVYRGGQSGTTALFYDFVQHTVPDRFSSWAARNHLPTNVRIIQLDSAPNFAPKTYALNGSDQIAQYVASNSGKWAIAYDEFGYAKTYHAPAAWVKNQSGEWVLPYAQNISAALEAAQLRPDLSQELAGVYASANPEAYPISAYSYMVTQCASTGDRATCKGPYTNPGVAETLAKWMRYIACDGQVNMARIGYSPLPSNLSQEISNSIARMQGTAPETLSAGNCSNPRFRGSLGEGAASPKDPLAGRVIGGQVVGAGPRTTVAQQNRTATAGAAAGGAGNALAAGSAIAGAGAPAGDVSGAVGRTGAVAAVGGGSGLWRAAAPVAYTRGRPSQPSSVLPAVLFILLLALPPLAVTGGWLARLDALLAE